MEKSDQWMDKAIEDLPGARGYYKTEWETDVFVVAEKIFAMLAQPKNETKLLTVKGDPTYNEELREMYTDIIPGYHMNKNHWISIRMNSSEISKELMEKLLQNSYQTVFAKLPKKSQKELLEKEELE